MFSRASHCLFRLFFCLVVCLATAADAKATAADAKASEATTPEDAPSGGRHRLTLRLRYPDGRPASGAVVHLRRMPDRDIVGWQFADNACRSDERGECHWSVWSGLYEFEFEGGLQPDSLTLAAAGGGGLHGLGVYLDQDFTVGLVLADPLTGGAGETLFFDQSPEAALPSYRVPGWEDLQPQDGTADLAAPANAAPPSLAIPASEPDAAAETAVADGETTTAPARRGLSWPLLSAAVLLAGGGFFFFRRSRDAAAPPTTGAPVEAPRIGAPRLAPPPAETETETETETES